MAGSGVDDEVMEEPTNQSHHPIVVRFVFPVEAVAHVSCSLYWDHVPILDHRRRNGLDGLAMSNLGQPLTLGIGPIAVAVMPNDSPQQGPLRHAPVGSIDRVVVCRGRTDQLF